MATHPHHKHNIDTHLQRTIEHALATCLWHGASPLPGDRRHSTCENNTFVFLSPIRSDRHASRADLDSNLDLELPHYSDPTPRRYHQATLLSTLWSLISGHDAWHRLPIFAKARIPRLTRRVLSFAPSRFPIVSFLCY